MAELSGGKQGLFHRMLMPDSLAGICAWVVIQPVASMYLVVLIWHHLFISSWDQWPTFVKQRFHRVRGQAYNKHRRVQVLTGLGRFQVDSLTTSVWATPGWNGYSARFSYLKTMWLVKVSEEDFHVWRQSDLNIMNHYQLKRWEAWSYATD